MPPPPYNIYPFNPRCISESELLTKPNQVFMEVIATYINSSASGGPKRKTEINICDFCNLTCSGFYILIRLA